MTYSMIIPVYNEEIHVKQLFKQLKTLSHNIEIIIINDGSTDKTRDILDNEDGIRIIHSPKNMGKGYSILEGAKYASQKNIILMDGDLEIELESVKDIIEKTILNEDQVIIGTRWNESSSAGKNINTYGNYFISNVFNLLYNTQLTDVLCCVKILNKKTFNSLNLKSKNFNIEMELMSKLAKRGATFIEKNVTYHRRKSSDGKK